MFTHLFICLFAYENINRHVAWISMLPGNWYFSTDEPNLSDMRACIHTVLRYFCPFIKHGIVYKPDTAIYPYTSTGDIILINVRGFRWPKSTGR